MLSEWLGNHDSADKNFDLAVDDDNNDGLGTK